MKQNRMDMCQGPILPMMIRFLLPVLATSALQQLFNAADMILARHLSTSGNDAVAAVGSTTALINLMINFFIGCSTGSAVVVSRAVGSRDTDAIKKTVHTAIALAVLIGALLTICGLAFSGTMLRLMDTPENIIGLSTAYLNAYFCGMIPYMVYYFGAAILRAMGDAKKPLYFLLISGPLKLILTVVFVSGFRLDVPGLALATSCSQIASAFLVVRSLMKREDASKLSLRELKFHAGPLKRILQLGIPSGLQSTTFSLSSVFVQTSVNSLAHLPGFVTGNAAACNIEAFANMLTSALYQTSISFTGQNAGARRYDRVKKVYITACGLSCALTALFSVLVCSFPHALLGLYIVDSPDALHWGTVRLMYIFAPLIVMGLMDVTTGALRGLAVSVESMLISLVGVCGFRILWGLTLFQIPEFHTPQVLFLCYPISWVITYAAELVLYVIFYQKRKRAGA